MSWRKVLFHKVDLDTALTALLAGVSEDTPAIFVLRARDEELSDPEVLCIEVGGSGQVEYSNFDHHEPALRLPPASWQAYKVFGPRNIEIPQVNYHLLRLVRYVWLVDEAISVKVGYPSLSNLFSGMLLCTKDRLEQFYRGIELLRKVLQNRWDPFQPIPVSKGMEQYLRAKELNRCALEKDLKDVVFFYTQGGRFGAYLRTGAIGGFRQLYERGAEIVVVHDGKGKFTIGSQGVELAGLLLKLQGIEPGWGGRAHIIGSPFSGSSLSAERLIRLIKESL